MNAFEEVCKLASNENWCWKLGCTTCGCLHFRYSFQELARGKSPSDRNWLVYSRRTNYAATLGDFPRQYSDEEKRQVLVICKNASLKRISEECRFPDWLGYLGLILERMNSDLDEYREVSQTWTQQLADIVPTHSYAHDRLDAQLRAGQLLSLADLEMCEGALYA
jgi:hypothetical protein